MYGCMDLWHSVWLQLLVPCTHTCTYCGGQVDTQCEGNSWLKLVFFPASPCRDFLEIFIRGGCSFLTMKGGHDEMKKKCGFYSKLDMVRGWLKIWGGSWLPCASPPSR